MSVPVRTLPEAPAMASFTEAFDRRGDLAGSLAASAWQRFVALGPPTTRLEEWRFTPPAAVLSTRFDDAVDGEAISPLPLGDWPRVEATIVGGTVRSPRAEAPGVRVFARREAASDPVLGARIGEAYGTIAAWQERAFVALNTALATDALVVHATRHAGEAPVVRVSFAMPPAPVCTTPRMAHPRVLVLADPGARLVLVEDLRGATAGDFLNGVLEFDLGEGAVVEHVVLTEHAPGARTIVAAFARLGPGAEFSSRSFALGAELARRDTVVRLAGEGASAVLDGLYVVTGKELVDHHTVADHAVPGCTSRELFKGVLDGASRAVFNGAVVIRPGAQKSDAAQSNHNLLLSEDATIHTKPELQIFADDVKCGHGATVGQLDDDQAFYLRARGIDPETARAILTHAFAREVVERIGHAGLRADTDALVGTRMTTLAEAR